MWDELRDTKRLVGVANATLNCRRSRLVQGTSALLRDGASTMRPFVLAVLAASLAWGCGAFKSSDSAPSGDAGGDAAGGGGGGDDDGGSSTGDGGGGGGGTFDAAGAGYAVEGTGPGPHGALPTGFCCTSDDECRGRKCADFGGVKTCSDTCSSDDMCNAVPGYACIGASASADGHCQPKATGTACIPAVNYLRGAKTLGACCTATHDGKNGFECQGGHCDAFLDENQPYICTQACTKASDCPGAYDCLPVTDSYAVCAPQATTSYTCRP